MAEDTQSGTTQPPIPDSNGNGMLDGEDLLTQMRVEEQLGTLRTVNETAHGVLEFLSARPYAGTFADEVRAEPTMERFEELSDVAAQGIAHSLESLGTLPQYKDDALWQEEHQILDRMAADGIDPVSIGVLRADVQHARDFADTYAQTFPNGVNIDIVDAPQILSHFGDIPVPVTPPVEQEKKDPGVKL